MIERCKTGIEGFDELIQGGFPRNRSILISGATGTGKTIFSMQFLVNGITKFNEPGVYVALDELPEHIRQDCLQFGWDLEKYERQNMLQIIDATVAKIGLPSEEEFSLPTTGFDLDKLLIEIMRAVKRLNAKRVVIDNIPSLGLNFETENEIRNAILKLSYVLDKINVTSLLITEINEEGQKFSKYGIEEYVVDGVIVLNYMSAGTLSNRTLFIRKMRATKHSELVHPIEITEKGIIVKKGLS